MKVDVITARDGGPFRWGQDLVHALRAERDTSASHLGTLAAVTPVLHRHTDLVHSTVPILPWIRKPPLILTVQGDYAIESILWREPYRRTLEEAAVVTTPSLLLRRKLGLDNAVVIPNAVFPDRFNCPVCRTERDIVRVVTVSNFHFLDKASGVLTIAELLSRLPGHRVEYTVAGDGKHLRAIRREASHFTTKPHFAGFAPDVRPLLTNSDIFLYYSSHDTFPIAILEAMASGLPVVTNDVGAVSEIIDNGVDGYVAQDNDAYTSYLAQLLDNEKLRTTIGARARAKVVERFNWHKVVGDFIDLYRSVS